MAVAGCCSDRRRTCCSCSSRFPHRMDPLRSRYHRLEAALLLGFGLRLSMSSAYDDSFRLIPPPFFFGANESCKSDHRMDIAWMCFVWVTRRCSADPALTAASKQVDSATIAARRTGSQPRSGHQVSLRRCARCAIMNMGSVTTVDRSLGADLSHIEPQQHVQHSSSSDAPTDSEGTATRGPQAGARRSDPYGISGSATAATASYISGDDATSMAEHCKCTAMKTAGRRAAIRSGRNLWISDRRRGAPPSNTRQQRREHLRRRGHQQRSQRRQ